MKKNFIKTILALVFLVVFNIIFFMTGGTDRESSVWMAYGFIHFSYLLLLFSGLMSGRSVELSMPVYTISAIYFVVNLVVGCVIITISPERIKVSLIIEILMLGIYLVFLCTTLLANEHTQEQEHNVSIERRYVHDCSANVKSMMDRTADRTVYKKLESVYDIIHASPTKTNASAMKYEMEVIRLLGVLNRNLSVGDMVAADQNIQDILRNAGARNRMLGARN